MYKIWNGEHSDAKNGYKYLILKANLCDRAKQKCHEADDSRAKNDVTSLKHIFYVATLVSTRLYTYSRHNLLFWQKSLEGLPNE
jgi:hypothetical protein